MPSNGLNNLLMVSNFLDAVTAVDSGMRALEMLGSVCTFVLFFYQWAVVFFFENTAVDIFRVGFLFFKEPVSFRPNNKTCVAES